jgi:glycogen synthase
MPTDAGRPSRVLMTADTVGGVWDYALQLAAGLAPYGVAVTLATMGRRLTADQWEAAAAVPALELFESGFRLEWMDEPWDDVAAAGEWLLELADRIDPDLVHLNGYVHGALPWDRPTLVAAHSCVCSWWSAVHRVEAPAAYDRYRRAVAAGLQAASAVVAPSRAMLRALSAHYGPIEGIVVPNGRDGADFADGPKQALVFSAGRLWDEAKNLSLLAAVASDVPWSVTAAGDICHPDGRPWRAGAVRCLGRLSAPEVRDWMARASIYALPARYEPFGLSILEAALSRCALVLGDIPSLREGWDGAAVFVAPNDPDALLAALRDLIDDDARRAELQRRAWARAQEFTVDRMALGYLRVYETLLPPPDAPSRYEAAPCAW